MLDQDSGSSATSSLTTEIEQATSSTESSSLSSPHDRPVGLGMTFPVTGLGHVVASNTALLSSTCDPAQLLQVVDSLVDEMTDALADKSSPNMLTSGSSSLPTGHETGSILTVDLGGSSLKIALVDLPLGMSYSEQHTVPKEIKTATGKQFFGWLADKISHVLNKNGITGQIDIGLSWSFPLRQASADSSESLIDGMGKGYTVINDIKGWSPKKALESSLKQLSIKANVKGVVNDAESTLLAHAYKNQATRIALILGTGINCCAQITHSGESMLVNTEISMLGSGIADTCWDEEVDEQVELPGYQPLETKVSGRYLGEISRLIIRDMAKAGIICRGDLPSGLGMPYELKSATVAALEQLSMEGRIADALELFQRYHPCESMTLDDIQQVLFLVRLVSQRSAALTACALVALASFCESSSEVVVVGGTGSVIEKYPGFAEACQKYIDIIGESRPANLKLELEEDGYFIGPAVAGLMTT